MTPPCPISGLDAVHDLHTLRDMLWDERAAHEETRREARAQSDVAKAHLRETLNRVETAERERDEARAALVALREAAEECPRPMDCGAIVCSRCALDRLLARAPAALAGQVRAKVLRDLAAKVAVRSELVIAHIVAMLEAAADGDDARAAEALQALVARTRA